MQAIEVRQFQKRYGNVEAVRGISFAVEQGELFGIIGPDGAGKTTLLRALCTLLLPDDGEILINGMNTRQHVADIRQIIGYMPQRFSLYQDLTVEQNLNFFADLFQVPEDERRARLEQLYRFSRLGPFKKRAAGALSGGMKQKLALSCALIHTPDILILDEPTFGVDPVSRQEFWDILHDIQRQGTTIVVSTAYMEEADLCDRVMLFHQGRILALDQPAALKAQYRFPLYRIEADHLPEMQTYFSGLAGVRFIQRFGDSLHVSFTTEPGDDLWEAAREQGLHHFERIAPSIEDIFLDLTTREEHESVEN